MRLPKCPYCDGEIDGAGLHIKERWRLAIHNCELYKLRELRDALIAVARKVGSGMPILSDPVVALAHKLSREHTGE